MHHKQAISALLLLLLTALGIRVSAQKMDQRLTLTESSKLEIINHFGRVMVSAIPSVAGKSVESIVSAASNSGVGPGDLKVDQNPGSTVIEVRSANPNKRVDLTITVPERISLRVNTSKGEVNVSGNFREINVKTDTGTIALDVPTDDLKYRFAWTDSRPRFVSDFDLENVREMKAGRFEIRGTYSGSGEAKGGKKKKKESKEDANADDPGASANPEVETDKIQVSRQISLDLATARGIVLVNVPQNEVGSDLRERPLTEAAKAIVRSGDSLLMEAIRRATPKYYGDYSRSLPPLKREPTFAAKDKELTIPNAEFRQALVRVTDIRNRSIAGLEAKDFEVVESGVQQEIISVERSTAPFNLVLLLDVSGSVENYVNFIRKAARSFVETVDRHDRVSIVTFNDDVKVISGFTTDKGKLSESLDTFDAGGGTAYYDALAFVISDTLRPLKGERTAIVVLTDGDDNRSFLAFDSLTGSIEESGALIYPLYVPSGLIALSSRSQDAQIDPLREKYMSLSERAEGEGEKLAKISGGVFYSISRLSQINEAYEDIARQLRTAYNVKYRSGSPTPTAAGASPRLKIRVRRPNTFTTISSVTAVK